MSLESFLEKTPEISEKRDYWFIRTEHGVYYDTFLENNFVAMGWNEISTSEIEQFIKTNNSDSIKKTLVALSQKQENERIKGTKEKFDIANIIDLSTAQGKAYATSTVNKLKNFYNLKKGDVVLIPNEGSSVISFGIIIDNGIYVNDKRDECSFRKRRKVKWIKTKDFGDLDKGFYNLKKGQHAITSIKEELAEQIDRVMNDVYFKEGFGHYVIRVKKRQDIAAEDLFGLGGQMMQLLKMVNELGGYNENVHETIVKINVQSKGDFLLKGEIGKSIVALAFLVNTIGCNSSDDYPQKLGQFAPKTEEHRTLMKNLKTNMDTLEISESTR